MPVGGGLTVTGRDRLKTLIGVETYLPTLFTIASSSRDRAITERALVSVIKRAGLAE